MKNITVILLMLITSIAFGQKQKEKDSQQAQIDKLTKSNKAKSDSIKMLSVKSDSALIELTKYYGLYTVIKDKVVKMDFNPAKMGQIIDSLKVGRDSLINLSGASRMLLQDSIKKVNHLSDSLRKEIEFLRYTVNVLKGGRGTNPQDPKEFTGSWSVILRKIKIVGESPRSGIIDASTDPVSKTASFLELNSVTNITFIDSEFAELTFSNGEKGKCYFVINDFSKTKPYSIDFKGTKADLRIYFMNTIVGPRVTLEVPGVSGLYYFGEMSK